MIDVSIIIVSYNTKEFLQKLLVSIDKVIEVLQFSCEVIVIDNASTDGSASVIYNFKFPISNFKMIKNKENLGFSKANNIGIQEAKGRYILFLNPDTVLNRDAVETLIRFMDANKDIGAVTGKVTLLNGEIDDATHRGFPTPWNALSHFLGVSRIFPKSRIFAGYSMGWEDFSKPHEIDACAGAFMMVRKEAGEQIKWWDEEYFFYGEDLDFCYRLKRKGWRIFYVPTVPILHYKGVSGGIKEVSKDITTANKQTRIRATNSRFQAMKIFYRKHYVKRYPSLLTWFVFKAIDLKMWASLKHV